MERREKEMGKEEEGKQIIEKNEKKKENAEYLQKRFTAFKCELWMKKTGDQTYYYYFSGNENS